MRDMVYQEEILINTSRHHDIHDIISKVSKIVERSGIQTGGVHVFNVGSTS